MVNNETLKNGYVRAEDVDPDEVLLGILGKGSQLKLQNQKIMLVGLYANGKTTTAGKLANFSQMSYMSMRLNFPLMILFTVFSASSGFISLPLQET